MDEKQSAGETFVKLLKILRFLRQYARKVRSEGIGPRDYSVLRFLLESGPATVGQIQAVLHYSPSTTSTLIARLEGSGYLVRTRSKVDNRVVMVELTAAGREIAEQTPLGGLPLLRQKLGTLPPERLRRLDQALVDIMVLLEMPDSDAFS